MSIGNALQIAFRLVTHWREIEDAWPEVIAVGNNVQHQLPLVQATINDAIRVAKQLNDLVAKIAPELMPARAFALAPVYDVRWLQASLNALMADVALDVDGCMGPPTIEAIKKFQASHGLVVDGWAGVVTESLIADLITDIGRPAGEP